MENESPQTRTLRLVVQDATQKNPLHKKASIWVRGYGAWWRSSFGTPLERYNDRREDYEQEMSDANE